MAETRPVCTRCGSFLAPEVVQRGLPVCEECIDRVLEPRASSMKGAVIFGLLGFLVIIVFAVFLGLASGKPGAVAVGLQLGFYVAPAGLVFGFIFDSVLFKREQRKRIEGFAWVAALDPREGGAMTEAGFAFPGEGCILFASRRGTRRFIRRGDVRATDLDDSRTELRIDLAPARLVLRGEGVETALARLKSVSP